MNVRFSFFLFVLICNFFLPLQAAFSHFNEHKDSQKVLYGIASYYGKGFHGKRTANGEIFDQYAMTAACNVLPLGTWIRVTNLANDHQVVVKVNDRLNYRMRRIADVSQGAAEKLGLISAGLTRVKIEVIEKDNP